MKKVIGYALCIVLTAAVVSAYFLLQDKNGRIQPAAANQISPLAASRDGVTAEMKTLSLQLKQKLTALASSLSADRDFAMKLLVEQDLSAIEIASVASQFIKPMGLSFLEIVDSTYLILSSGHLPASAGNTAVGKKTMAENALLCLTENVKGLEILSFQMKIPFSISGNTLYCIGGIMLDDEYISSLNHYNGIEIILKNGESITGSEKFRALPQVVGDTVVVGTSRFASLSLLLPYLDSTQKPQLLFLKQL